MKYWNGSNFTFDNVGECIEVTDEQFDTLTCGKNKGLHLSSNSDGYPSLHHPYTGEEYTGDYRDFDITAEAEYVEAQRVAAINDAIAIEDSYLKSTDWTVTKCIELGLTMDEKYPDIKELRAAARARINSLEAELFQDE